MFQAICRVRVIPSHTFLLALKRNPDIVSYIFQLPNLGNPSYTYEFSDSGVGSPKAGAVDGGARGR